MSDTSTDYIPRDILEAARAALETMAKHMDDAPLDDQTGLPLLDADDHLVIIARVIRDERERCAAVADWGVKWTPPPPAAVQRLVDESCSRIAAAIRRGEPASTRKPPPSPDDTNGD